MFWFCLLLFPTGFLVIGGGTGESDEEQTRVSEVLTGSLTLTLPPAGVGVDILPTPI